MRHASLKQSFLCGVSLAAVHVASSVSPVREAVSSVEYGSSSFLARIGLWLRLIFGGFREQEMTSCIAASPREIKPNRAQLRKRAPARQADGFGYHIMRRYGYAACLEWVYNRTLKARIVWCFKDWMWRHMPRELYAGCSDEYQMAAACSASLWPD